MRKRRLVMILAVVAMVMGAMAPASAGGTACAGWNGTGWANHGSHITGDYVGGSDGNAGGGAPAHFHAEAFTPGATFCNQHGQGGARAASPTGPSES